MPDPAPFDRVSLGWNPFFETHRRLLGPGLVPGRVAAHHGQSLVVLTGEQPVSARLGGRLRHGALSPLSLPAVGDWVGVRLADRSHGVIDVVLPRASQLVRQAAGDRVEPQVVAANVDVVAVVMAMGADFNLRRVERYLAVIEPSGATAMIILSKADLCADVADHVRRASGAASGVPVIALSAISGAGIDALRGHLRPGLTLAAVGSSGVGKSTLVNALLGREAQKTGAVRESDGRGRHVTTHRELFVIPGGALLVDTPGMKELATWADGPGDPDVFRDIRTLAEACRFGDCGHAGEPGCEIARAVADGRLDPARLESHRKLGREMAWQAARQDAALRKAQQSKWKAITKSMRGFTKEGR